VNSGNRESRVRTSQLAGRWGHCWKCSERRWVWQGSRQDLCWSGAVGILPGHDLAPLTLVVHVAACLGLVEDDQGRAQPTVQRVLVAHGVLVEERCRREATVRECSRCLCTIDSSVARNGVLGSGQDGWARPRIGMHRVARVHSAITHKHGGGVQ
jgi:hypothetical protein